MLCSERESCSLDGNSTADEFEFMTEEDSQCEVAEVAPETSAADTVSCSSGPLAKRRSYWGLLGSRVYYAIAQDMMPTSLRRLQDYFRNVSTTLPTSTSDLWLLGICYELDNLEEETREEVVHDFIRDFNSRIWVTYRRGFEAIGDSSFTSDAGWGCTIRSGQMLLAQALMTHFFQRAWRRETEAVLSPQVKQVLSWFGDAHDDKNPFGIHHFIESGRAIGVEEGHWLGPYIFCRTVAGMVNANAPGGMVAHVVAGDASPAGGSGGAPVLCKCEVRDFCLGFSTHGTPRLGFEMEPTVRDSGSGSGSWSPVLLLVPLVLGLGEKINERYIPLLAKVLTFPQSVGIVGGRPGSSLYFVGCQDENVFFLDPHTVQPTTNAADEDFDMESYFCQVLRHMPMSQIDPSLALGFYCRTEGDFESLCTHLAALETQSRSVLLLTVVEKRSEHHIRSQDIGETSETVSVLDEEEDATGDEDWQLL